MAYASRAARNVHSSVGDLTRRVMTMPANTSTSMIIAPFEPTTTSRGNASAAKAR